MQKSFFHRGVDSFVFSPIFFAFGSLGKNFHDFGEPGDGFKIDCISMVLQ